MRTQAITIHWHRVPHIFVLFCKQYFILREFVLAVPIPCKSFLLVTYHHAPTPVSVSPPITISPVPTFLLLQFSPNFSYMPILCHTPNCLLLTHRTALVKLEKSFPLEAAAAAQTAKPGDCIITVCRSNRSNCPTWQHPFQPSADWRLPSPRKLQPILWSLHQRCASFHSPPSQRQ